MINLRTEEQYLHEEKCPYLLRIECFVILALGMRAQNSTNASEAKDLPLSIISFHSPTHVTFLVLGVSGWRIPISNK